MQITKILKSTATIAASTGVGAIVGNAIKASSPSDMNKIQKFTIAVGSMALSGMIATQASNYTGEQIDEIVTQIKELKQLSTKNDD